MVRECLLTLVGAGGVRDGGEMQCELRVLCGLTKCCRETLAK